MHTERLRILLVDDEDIDRRMTECFIQKAKLPYDLVVARNVAEAIAHLCARSFDLVLTEYRLSDGYGLEVQQYAPSIPCIYLTRIAARDVVIRVMKAGAYDFLVKDSQWDYLRELPIAILEALERQGQNAASDVPPAPLYVNPGHAIQP